MLKFKKLKAGEGGGLGRGCGPRYVMRGMFADQGKRKTDG